MQKNIVFLTGRDTYAIELEVAKWKRLFAERHSDTNIDHLHLEELRDQSAIWRQNILSGGLFADKRLFVISGGNEKRDKTTDFVAFFTEIFSVLPEDHILLFHSLTERATALADLVKEYGDVRTFDTVFSLSVWEGRFPALNPTIISRVVQHFATTEQLLEEYERNPLVSHTIAGILTSLSHLALTVEPSDADIDALIGNEGGGKMFDLVDAILADDTKRALTLFDRIAGTKSMFEILPSLLGLLRNTLYIKYLSEHSIPTNGIKVHPFVMKKTLTSRISLSKIQKLYKNLVQTSIAYKSGKGMKDVELGRILGIELGLLGLKK